MASKFFDIFFPKEEKLNEVSLKDEENFKYFEGTEKYGKHKQSNYITNFFDKNNKVIGRKFLDKDKKDKYLELFENKKLKVIGISPNITFIHSFSHDNNECDKQKFIGFRYYQNGPFKNGKFFTLIRRNYSHYFILEKNLSVKDIEDSNFYDKELNCYDIIKNIIIKKYKSKIIGSNGDAFPEIIGYCYALESMKQVKNLMFMEPLIANIEEKTLIKESIDELKDNLIYIEPFIYDGHISLILVSKWENQRYNLMLDMSHHHFDYNKPSLSFLPKSLKSINNIFCPPEPIQEYSSCCLWIFGEVECLIKNQNYSSINNIYESTSYKIDFYVDVINYLSKEIDGVDCAMKKEEKSNKDNNFSNEINFDRFLIPFDNNYYSLHKDIVYSKFLCIENLLDKVGNFIYLGETRYLAKFQGIIKLIYEYKNCLLLNLEYYSILPENEDVLKYKDSIEKAIDRINIIINYFKNEYDYAFYNMNMLFYTVYIKNVMDKISIPFVFEEERKKKVIDFNKENFVNDVEKNYLKMKNLNEKDIRLFSQDNISRELNSLNDLCFSVMNK